jgi:hypothetical protein
LYRTSSAYEVLHAINHASCLYSNNEASPSNIKLNIYIQNLVPRKKAHPKLRLSYKDIKEKKRRTRYQTSRALTKIVEQLFIILEILGQERDGKREG